MKIKKKISKAGRNIGFFTGIALAIITAINVPLIGLRALQEVAQNKILKETKKEYRATLKDLGYSDLIQTKGYLNYGDFEFEDGKMIRIYDSQRVLQGKLFPNTRLPYGDGIGKTYELKTIGSDKVGYDVLEAKVKE